MSASVDSQPSWRERLRDWTQPPRELVMTSSGKFLCLITLGVGFGAVNTGNNLLFLLLGMLLSLILASGVLSEAVVARVEAKRRLPSRLVAGSGGLGGYRVQNPKRFPSLSIEVSDRNATAVAGPAVGEHVGPPTIAWWKVWRGPPRERHVANSYTLRLDEGADEELDARFEIAVRGRWRLHTMRVTTRFPFGLFEKSRRVSETAEITVLPAGIDASDWVASVRGRFGDVATNRRGMGEEFFGLRDYRVGEDRRRIHWKTTARRGAAVVRETEQVTQREVEIVFCDWSPQPVSAATFEVGVSKTVGLVTALSAMGWRVGLRTRDLTIPPNTGASHVDAMLASLAVVVPGRTAPDWGSADVARIAIGPTIEAVASVDADVSLAFEDEDA